MCAELLIAQCVAQQAMQIAIDRQTTRGFSGLLPGVWKVEIFGTKGKCLPAEGAQKPLLWC